MGSEFECMSGFIIIIIAYNDVISVSLHKYSENKRSIKQIYNIKNRVTKTVFYRLIAKTVTNSQNLW